MGDNKHVHRAMCTLLVLLSQAELANYSYSELSYVSAKLYRISVDWQCIVQDTICRGPRQLRLCNACTEYATNIELHVHTYAVGVADIAACKGSPHNVLHSSSNKCLQLLYSCTISVSYRLLCWETCWLPIHDSVQCNLHRCILTSCPAALSLHQLNICSRLSLIDQSDCGSAV